MKLSKRQRTALEKSIKKWEGIVDDEEEDEGPADCECCIKYNSLKSRAETRENCCKECPVFMVTGKQFCAGSPFEKWEDYMEENEMGEWRVFDEYSLELAQAELDFLRNILNEATP
jgi:hypothetical protein